MSDATSIHLETHLKVLRLLEAHPQMSQRELAVALGVSLGKTNFCLKALVDKGWLKVQNFQSSRRKLAYAYLLTPAGLAEKAALTRRFLMRKTEEFALLKVEIELLQQEAAADPHALEQSL
jgi:EPS-associated MarR family transcriptional regulator